MPGIGGRVYRLETLLAMRTAKEPPIVITYKDDAGRLLDFRTHQPVNPPPGAQVIIIATRNDGPQ